MPQTSSVHGLASSQSGSVVHSIAVPARALRKSQVAGNGWSDPFEVDRIPIARILPALYGIEAALFCALALATLRRSIDS